jgi:hypothetical protein
MNDLDWVLFMGTAHWTKARLYQWHEKTSVWTRMEPAQNTLAYMEALRDITDGAPDGIFSTVFCKVLFAQQAAIATLESQLIKIGNAIYGGQRFKPDGSVQDGSKPGFWLGTNGKLKAFDGEFTGTVNATDGNFSGNFSANIATGQFSYVSLPMVGATRGYMIGNWSNSSGFAGSQTDNIAGLRRLDAGKFRLILNPSNENSSYLGLCHVIGYYTKTEDAAGWPQSCGIILSSPGVAYGYDNDLGGWEMYIKIAFKNNASGNYEDPLRLFLMIAG